MLYDTIRDRFNSARKDGNTLVKEAYGAVIAKIEVIEKSGKYSPPLADDVVENAIQKQINEYKETQSYYKPDAKDYTELQTKIDTLTQYLPQAFTEEEVIAIIREEAVINTVKGKLIGATIKRVGNRYDKSKIASLVDSVLNN